MHIYSEITPLRIEDKSIIKLYRYRWVELTIFSLYCITNFFLTFQFIVIADITQKYYNISSLICNASGLVFIVVYLVFFVPIGRFMKNHGLRSISIISTGLTAFGNLFKLYAVPPDRFYMILISQCICGIAQVFMMGLPPKVASVWFGSEEVSMACGIGVMSCQLGIAMSSALPIFLVPHTSNTKEVADGFYKLYVCDNIASIILFVIVLLFFRSKPRLPPSFSQVASREGKISESTEIVNIKSYLKNKDFLLILYCFGTAWGLWNSNGITMNEMFINYFPTVGKILWILLTASILLGGVIGSIIFGFIMDKTHEFKKLSLFVMIMICLSWSLFIFFIQDGSLIGTCTSFLMGGFFGGSLVVTALEYSTEVIYPLPEAFGTTLLIASVYFFSIFYTILSEYIFANFGFLTGQVVISIAFRTAAIGCIFISSDFKRREANLLLTFK